jgi:hypothetical protein
MLDNAGRQIVMANIISADEILAGGGGLYLNSEDKASLHTEQRAFYITSAVAEQEGQYGVQTVFTIKEKGKDDARLAFQASASRIEQAKKITVAVANGADAIGPFYLGRWESNGRSGWQLTNAPSTPERHPGTLTERPEDDKVSRRRIAAPVASVAPTTDDDIPF